MNDALLELLVVTAIILFFGALVSFCEAFHKKLTYKVPTTKIKKQKPKHY